PTATITSGTSATMRRTASSAAPVRSVTSATVRPPASSAFAGGTASSACSMVSTGITGVVISGAGSESNKAMTIAPNRRPSREVPDQRQAREQAADREHDRGQQIERSQADFVAFGQQRHVERECREGGVAA